MHVHVCMYYLQIYMSTGYGFSLENGMYIYIYTVLVILPGTLVAKGNDYSVPLQTNFASVSS